MNAYNPLASMKRLEEAGVPRGQAEAIAGEIGDSTSPLVTAEQLDAALNKAIIKISVVVGAMLTLACTVIGTLVALFAAYK